jgi:hypothetical protein
MSGSVGSGSVDLTLLLAGQSNMNQLLSQILLTLRGGVIVQQAAPSYTVAGLPATSSAGTTAWASNGRKPAEGAGAGSGVPVFWNPATSQWFSYLSCAVVTA